MKNSRAPKKGVSPKSTTRSIASIRQFHKFCVNEGFSKNNPAENIESLKLPIRLPKALTIYEMFKLLEVAGTGDSPTALRDSALLEFMYATGARASEAANLSIDDLNVNDESVRILGKGSKERIIPVGKIALERMDAYMVRSRPALIEISNRDTPLSQSDFSKVFLNKRGSVLTRTTLWWIIKDVAKRAGIDREVTPHSIRHSFATHILQGGADIRVVQELLGHSNVSTTQIYTLVTQETLRENYALYHPRA
jgi:integrase/recombinase XerD